MSDRIAFAASWDRRLAFVTLLLTAVLLGVAALTLHAAADRSSVARIVATLSAAIPIIVFLATAAHAPRGYTVEAHEVMVERPIGPLAIGGVQGAERIAPDALDGSVRMAAVGGLFGYYGHYANDALGPYRMYATRSSDHVLVRTSGGPVVLTPADPAGFVAAVNGAG